MDKTINMSHPVLDNYVYVVNIQSTCSYISSYEDTPAFRVTVFVKDLTPSALIHITMQSHKLSVLERANLLSVIFSFSENYNFLVFVF